MQLDSFLHEIRDHICKEIEIYYEGKNRIMISSPVSFDDGDSFNIILKKGEDGWYFTDEGNTLMHLSYYELDKNLELDKRKEILESLLFSEDIINDGGELKLYVENEDFGYGYFKYLQSLVNVVDIASFPVTKRESIASIFREEFRRYLREMFGDRCAFDYKNEGKDSEGKYQVDCAVENKVLFFFFGLYNDAKCRDATITCHMFREWGINFVPIVVFEDQEKINRKVLGRLTDIIDKQFSTLSSAKEELPGYLSKYL